MGQEWQLGWWRGCSRASGQKKNPHHVEARWGFRGSDGRRSRDLTIFSRALYQLSYRAEYISCTNGDDVSKAEALPCERASDLLRP
ncbi:hypothetical protein PLANTIT3_60198 [Plantibacter sp. T3]|nr:hypothetical protein PLANTIT3_60198 [Plantibacter sp. T3]